MQLLSEHGRCGFNDECFEGSVRGMVRIVLGIFYSVDEVGLGCCRCSVPMGNGRFRSWIERGWEGDTR